MIRASWMMPALGWVAALATLAADPSPIPVEPSELSKRGDLLGREVVVDDRIGSYQYREGRLTLKRSPILFRIPPSLRREPTSRDVAARVQGILRQGGDQGICEVTSLDLLPNDLARLERAIGTLTPGDFEARAAWARWAERRGGEFKDADLLERARSLEGEATRIEAERPSTDPAKTWLALARRARSRQVPEPEPSALAHAAFRARLAAGPSADNLKALVAEIETFFPRASQPVKADLGAWVDPYDKAPTAGYRAAPGSARVALDHRLWADATQRLLERLASDTPRDAPQLAEQAATQLPDRPEVARRLLDEGLTIAARDLASLRRAEVESMARLCREKLGQPERARALIRDWLDNQRLHRLSPTDAEGRVLLANQYETMLGDQASAIDLLRAAWRIDPKSKEVADAFRRHDYRKVNDEWVESARSRARADATPADAPTPAMPSSDKLLRKSARDVRTLLGGKPNRVLWSASREELIEQWIYFGPTQNQYINFLHTPGNPVARVVAYYSRPRTASDPVPAP